MVRVAGPRRRPTHPNKPTLQKRITGISSLSLSPFPFFHHFYSLLLLLPTSNLPSSSLLWVVEFTHLSPPSLNMVFKDDWLTAAMADDTLVVELLIRLKQSQASSSIKSTPPSVIPPRWGLRQRRSRIPSPFRFDAISHKNKDSTSTRCSPTTPLSWSGDTSPSASATADGFEHSSHPSGLSHSSRSKVLSRFYSFFISFSPNPPIFVSCCFSFFLVLGYI